MATVIDNTDSRSSERPVVVERDSSDSAAGWMVAAIVVIAVVLLGLYIWPRFIQPSVTPTPQAPGTNVNVTLPSTDTGASTGNTSGGASGSASTPGTNNSTPGATPTTQ